MEKTPSQREQSRREHIVTNLPSSPPVLFLAHAKALEVTRQINCVTNFLPECEEQLRETKKKEKGLLYGVPVSIKEDVACKVLSAMIPE